MIRRWVVLDPHDDVRHWGDHRDIAERQLEEYSATLDGAGARLVLWTAEGTDWRLPFYGRPLDICGGAIHELHDLEEEAGGGP